MSMGRLCSTLCAMRLCWLCDGLEFVVLRGVGCHDLGRVKWCQKHERKYLGMKSEGGLNVLIGISKIELENQVHER